MRILDRYLRRTVFLAMLVVLLVLLGLDVVFTLFEELSDTDENYGSADALRYVLLTLPRHLHELLPMAALIGALTGLGVLAANNELAIMQAAGVRSLRIVWAVMKPTLLIMVLGLVTGEYVAPPLELRAELGKAQAYGEQVILSAYGTWQRDDEQFMHFNAIDPDAGVLHGVTLYTYDDAQQLQSTIVAEQAVYENAAWRLETVRETLFLAQPDGSLRSELRDYETLPWALDLTPELLQVLIMDPDRMAVSDLYDYGRYFESQGQDADPYFLAFWKKLLQPLATASLVLVAISFIFGPLRGATMGYKLFVAISFGLLFVLLQRLLGTVSLVYQVAPLGAVLLPIVISALIGTVLLRRAA